MTGRDSLMAPADNRRMFDAIARRYDLMNRVLSFGLDRIWRRQAVAALAPTPGGRYLDIGCGTGDIGIEILHRCRTARVVGLDPAEEMLAIARSKIAAAGLSAAITFQPGDATALPFDDSRFDGITMAFCIRNVSDRLAAMREACRMLPPGGRLVILELSIPPNPLIAAAGRLFNRHVVPLAGRLIAQSPHAYRYLIDSIAAFPPPDEIVAMLLRAGFPRAQSRPIHTGIVTLFTATGD